MASKRSNKPFWVTEISFLLIDMGGTSVTLRDYGGHKAAMRFSERVRRREPGGGAPRSLIQGRHGSIPSGGAGHTLNRSSRDTGTTDGLAGHSAGHAGRR